MEPDPLVRWCVERVLPSGQLLLDDPDEAFERLEYDVRIVVGHIERHDGDAIVDPDGVLTGEASIVELGGGAPARDGEADRTRRRLDGSAEAEQGVRELQDLLAVLADVDLVRTHEEEGSSSAVGRLHPGAHEDDGHRGQDDERQRDVPPSRHDHECFPKIHHVLRSRGATHVCGGAAAVVRS